MTQERMFDAPIPGASLTAPVGGRPWKNPPEYSTVEEAIEFYADKLADKKIKRAIIEALDLGLAVTTIANGLQLSAVMEGLHSADVGMLTLPIIMEMIMLIAEVEGIKYTSGLDGKTIKSKASVQKALNTLNDNLTTTDMKKDMSTQAITEAPIDDMEQPQVSDAGSGLMARRV